MKVIFIIILFLVLQSCAAKDFKIEISKAFKTKDAKKIEHILNEYYQINGTDALLEISYIKLALLKNDFKRVFQLYQNTNNIEVKKNKEIQLAISDFVIESNNKIELSKRLPYYKKALEVFPYSEKIYKEYLDSLLKLNKINYAIKVYSKYDEIFNKDYTYLTKILSSQLKLNFKKKNDVKILEMIYKLDKNTSFLESEIIKNPKLLLKLKTLPKKFDVEILKKIIPNKNYSLSKAAIKFFILIGAKDVVEPYMKNLYKKSPTSLKSFIYYYYEKRFNEKIGNLTPLNKKSEQKEIIVKSNDKNIKIDLNNSTEILKDSKSSEEAKAKALGLMIKNKKDISFFKEYNNYIYYLIFLKNSDNLDNKLLDKISFIAYKNWKDSKMLIKYLKRLNVKEIDEVFSQKKIKEIKNQYYIKLIYYSVILLKTDDKNNDFKKFIIKNRFSKLEYLDLFKFSEKHISILIKLYIVENRFDMENKILEKLVEILDK